MKNFIQYVNPNIGTIGHLLQATSPTVTLPHGMMQVSPVFTPGVNDRYLADKIYSFPLGYKGLGMFMPTTSEVDDYNKNASSFDHDFEEVSPGEYSVLLEDSDINCSFTVDKHSVIYKVNMPKQGYIMLYLPLQSSFEDGVFYYNEKGNYGICEISGLLNVEKSLNKLQNKYLCWRCKVTEGKIFIKAAISYIDLLQAEENLKNEIPNFNYEKVRKRAIDIWNKKLGTIEVLGGSLSEKRVFYTALYRSVSRMQCISEYGRYYSGYDKKVHDDEGFEFYVNDGMWDTFRTAHPLQQMIEPEIHRDILQSYIRMYKQSGWLPDFPDVQGNRPVMLGNHTAALFADSVAKNVDFDIKTAFEAVKKNATEASMLPWYDGKATELDLCYYEKGFFPALEEGREEYIPEVHSFERRQCVSVTLEHAYDDWCCAVLAKKLGYSEDYDYFLKRSKNYMNLFNKETGFMAPKTADGKWVENFNPKNCGGQGGRAYFAENNAWIYTFNVMHDNEGLIDLFGGVDKFNEKLDRLFIEQPSSSKFDFLKQYPDSTGLVGLFCMGNEPSFHIPYLYNYSGKPYKTQRKVREMMSLWFNDSPLGICGDEDGGAMSSWFVFSAIGFYPVCPGSGLLDIGSPIFDGCIINNGKSVFKVTSQNASGKSKYVQSAVVNGNVLNEPRFSAEYIEKGGELILTMSDRPKLQ